MRKCDHWQGIPPQIDLRTVQATQNALPEKGIYLKKVPLLSLTKLFDPLITNFLKCALFCRHNCLSVLLFFHIFTLLFLANRRSMAILVSSTQLSI